ncbi:hypothetical protein [Pseudomonas fluorescens]|nr:hypothetical protein [Pseudomonas fluorescens]
MKSLLVFPAAFMANTFALTVVMIGLSLFGKPELAADFGIVHGATVALFYAFSGNTRSLILGGGEQVKTSYHLRLRCFMLIPLYLFAVILSVGLVASSIGVILLLIGRRACEWLAEVFLSEQEREHLPIPAFLFFLTQGVLSLLVLVTLVLDSFASYAALALWAISPLFWCMRRDIFADALKRPSKGTEYLRVLLPNFGSTAVIGASVYIIRVFIILLVGREIAGDFFSAFALGGILGSVFALALGPTLVRHEGDSSRVVHMVRILNCMLAVSFGLGILLAGLSIFNPDVLLWTGKSSLFWLAVGSSLIGGVVMVRAQRVRLRLLQGAQGKDTFGADILTNILLVGCAPFLYYILGVEALSGVYLLGAILSLVFYSSEAGVLFARFSQERWVYYLLACFIFSPLFIQLSAGIYQGEGVVHAGEVKFAMLPIPISVLVCYVGIVMLGGFSKARMSLVFIFFTFVGMFLTSLLLATDYGLDERSKLTLLLQYMLPMFALVLGQQYASGKDADLMLAKSIFWVLIVIVPLQVASTVIEDTRYLSSSLYLFSVYQGASYVPVVFVGGFLLVLFSFWRVNKYREGLVALSFFMGIYATFSASLIALAFFIAGVFLFLARSFILRIDIARALRICGLAYVAVFLAFQFWLGGGLLRTKSVALPHNWSESFMLTPFREALELRASHWGVYYTGFVENISAFLLGHTHVLDRKMFPSAYNYYLDFLYNFGFIAALPLLVIIAFAIYKVADRFAVIFASDKLCGLTVVTLFMLLVDNSLQVGMRQPYSGIVVFFLLGILLSSICRQDGDGLPRSGVV